MGEAKAKSSKRWVKLTVLGAVIAAFCFLYFQFGDAISLESLAKREGQLRQFQSNNPWLVLGVAFIVYVVFTGLSIPGASLLSLMYGWYFGLWQGLLLISFASTIGATLAFLLSRYLFRDFVQDRFGKQLTEFNRSLESEGPFYLFTLRLIPAVPFFVINAVMGLTRMRVWTYYWVSQIGMLPGTFVYLYAGSRVPSLQRLAEEKLEAVFTSSQIIQIAFAFTILGLFPLVVRWTLRVSKGNANTRTSAE